MDLEAPAKKSEAPEKFEAPAKKEPPDPRSLLPPAQQLRFDMIFEAVRGNRPEMGPMPSRQEMADWTTALARFTDAGIRQYGSRIAAAYYASYRQGGSAAERSAAALAALNAILNPTSSAAPKP